jgi:hypothetical protein
MMSLIIGLHYGEFHLSLLINAADSLLRICEVLGPEPGYPDWYFSYFLNPSK